MSLAPDSVLNGNFAGGPVPAELPTGQLASSGARVGNVSQPEKGGP